ncbi:hypothetical protein VP1G_01913 [Cytospora mali]|uniref:F-box domain-containing protein n=1 Tax=Cytospora mali TaxID=578113 RepID=A0A194USC2_CYTMA|nr:hypothetical protein VP1G_01913 [Valsa mali var. pyri (nom. inval.)]
MEHVLNTPELLEIILESLEPQTLLTSATRVCHYWNNLISDSLNIQRALFLLPERPSKSTYSRANPLLLPLLTGLSASTIDLHSLLNDYSHNPNTNDKFLRTEATWRHMLVQQPPATKLGIWKIEFSGRGFQHIFEGVDVSDMGGGLGMNQFLGLAKQWKEQGYTWDLFWGEDGKALLEKERNSLLLLKVGIS